MKKLIPVLLLLWSLVLFWLTINQCTSQNPEGDPAIPDTVYLPTESFEPLTTLPQVDQPRKVILYGYDSDSPSGSEEPNPVSAIPNVKSLAQLKRSESEAMGDSLSSFNLTRENLRLDFLNTSTERFTTKLYKLDLENNQYTFVNGTLTHKKLNFYQKKDFIKPYVYAQYRPFNSLWDIGGGINFKTGKINYQIGINSFYYPKLDKHGLDLELRLQYNF